MFPVRFLITLSTILMLILSQSLVLAEPTEHQASPENATDAIVTGHWEIEYLVTDPYEMLVPVAVETTGYIQTVRHRHRGYKVTVTCPMEPIMIRSTIETAEKPEQFPESLWTTIQAQENRSDVLRILLGWLEQNLPYGPDISNNCVGRSNKMVEMLNQLNVKSRSVSGCLYKNGETHFHRWIEVDYPGIGSLPTEPGSTQDYVTPHHLILLPSSKADPGVNRLSELGVSVTVKNEKRSFFIIDRKPVAGSVPCELSRRQVQSERSVAALSGTVLPVNSAPFVVIIQGSQDYHQFMTDEFGCFSLAPIESGTYSISIGAEGLKPYKSQLSIGPREHSAFRAVLSR